MTIGILSACDEENASLREALEGPRAVETVGRREFHRGRLEGRDVVVAFSRWGKVAAASTATVMIERHEVSALAFTGVAGALDPSLALGDVVVADRLAQHDMNAEPIFPRHEIPLLGKTWFETDPALRRAAVDAAERYLGTPLGDRVSEEDRRVLRLGPGRVHVGPAISGDRFVASTADAAELRSRFPEARCVEMEGAAVAQVSHESGIPFVVVRTISDAADDEAGVDFPRFLERVAAAYSLGIVRGWLRALPESP